MTIQIQRQTVQQIADQLMELPTGTRNQVLAPMISQKKGEFVDLFKELAAGGYSRALNELDRIIADLNDQMLQAAGELKFELAARLRDELSEMKKELRQIESVVHVRQG